MNSSSRKNVDSHFLHTQKVSHTTTNNELALVLDDRTVRTASAFRDQSMGKRLWNQHSLSKAARILSPIPLHARVSIPPFEPS